MDATMPCKKEMHSSTRERVAELNASQKVPKTKCGCKMESHESTRQRVEPSPPKNHEDHIAGKRKTSKNHENLVHKFILVPKAMKTADAKTAVDKEWKKLETIPAWQLEQVKSKKEVIFEAQRDRKKVIFATLTDMCHLKKAELEPQLQKYKGRVVLRGDIVKDDSGAYAVFTEQGLSASQMTAAQVMDVIARLTDKQLTESAYTHAKLEDAPILLRLPKSACPDVWICLPRHKWDKH